MLRLTVCSSSGQAYGVLWQILTRNHRGVAILFLVAVFVRAEALHKARVALTQQLENREGKSISKDVLRSEETSNPTR